MNVFMVFCLLMPSMSFGWDVPTIAPRAGAVSEEGNWTFGRVAVAPSFYRITNTDGNILSGIAVESGFTYAVNERIAAGPRLQQAYTPENGLATLFNMIGVDIDFALYGKLSRLNRKTRLYDTTVVDHTGAMVSGLRFNIHLSQYYINSFTAAVPFSGIGFGLYYEYPVLWSLNAKGGIELENVTSGEIDASVVRVSLGLVSLI